MKRLSFLVFFLLAASVSVLAQAQAEPGSWQRYTVDGEDLSVMFPTPPTIKTNEIFATRLEKKRFETLIGSHADGVVYALSICQNANQRQSLKDFITQQNEIEG